jgi:RecG-like helicase
MKATNDGFYIAEQDLKLRGGGELLGTKQSGEQTFIIADLLRDLDQLTAVNYLVSKLLIDLNKLNKNSFTQLFLLFGYNNYAKLFNLN